MFANQSAKLKAKSSELLEKYDGESKATQKHEGQLTVTHGFSPYSPIPKQMPVSHQVWDEMAKKLPELLKNYQERVELAKLPLLSADEKAFPDQYLARASLILGSLAHAYYFNQRDLSATLPEAIKKPWEEVARRLERPNRARTNYDNFLYDWQLIDSTKPRTLDNVKLLEPIFNTNAEHSFNLAIFLMETHFAPALVAMTKAQDAVLNNDNKALAVELDKISECLEFITADVISKIDPNPYSATFADPVIWGKTVARFDQGTWEKEPGVSGSSSPLFHALDEFTGRKSFVSEFGQQIRDKRKWMPKQHVDFINSLQAVSVKSYIEKTNDPVLLGKFQHLMKCYVEADGLLGKHMRKVYGYIGLTFKAGRPKTNGGQVSEVTIHGKFHDANKERREHLRFPGSYAVKANQRKLGSDTYAIQLDISKTGLVFKPGDICQITLEEASDTKSSSINIKQTHSRYYSVTPTANPEIIQLTITAVGLVSHYLTTAKEGSQFSLQRVPAHLFHLPTDNNKPIIMFAMGNGIAPLLGFVNERTKHVASKNWLYYTTGTTENYYYRAELEGLVKKGCLNIRTLITQEKKLYKSQAESKVGSMSETPHVGRIDTLFEQKAEAEQLYQLLQQGAAIYICGKTSFAETIRDAVKKLLIKYGNKTEQEAQTILRQWIANNRLIQDAFYATRPEDSKDKPYVLSEVIQHNNAAKGYWSIVDGKVYDFTKLMHSHPGGDKILMAYGGLDVTEAYQNVNHHLDPRIHNLLPGYYVGELCLPKLDVTRQTIYHAWHRLVVNVAGIENNLVNNTKFKAPENRTNYLINDVLATFINDGFRPHITNLLPEVQTLVSSAESKLSFSQRLKEITEQKECDMFFNLNQIIKERHIAFMQKITQKSAMRANKIYSDLYLQLFGETQKFLAVYKSNLISGMQLLERQENGCDNLALQACLDKALVIIKYFIKSIIEHYQNYKLADKESEVMNGKPLPVSLPHNIERASKLQVATRPVNARDLFGMDFSVRAENKPQFTNRYRFLTTKEKVFIKHKDNHQLTSNVKFKQLSR